MFGVRKPEILFVGRLLTTNSVYLIDLGICRLFLLE